MDQDDEENPWGGDEAAAEDKDDDLFGESEESGRGAVCFKRGKRSGRGMSGGKKPGGRYSEEGASFDLEERTRRSESVKKDLSQYKTEGGVFNFDTLRNIGKLGAEGKIDRIMGPIATGKEADVFLGELDKKRIVIKIFRLASASYFKKPTVLQYIIGDERFKKVKRTPRDLIKSWVMKEFRNLKKAEELGVSAPKALAIEGNVLVMQYIGDEDPSPQLLRSPPKDANAVGEVFDEVVAQVKMMYKGGLVHADLSEYNILVKGAAGKGKGDIAAKAGRGEHPVLIDWGQAVLLTHPMAESFFERDVKNICSYFKRLGVACDAEAIVKSIRGRKAAKKKTEGGE